MEQQNQSYLATEKIGGLMRKYAVPCVISLLVLAVIYLVFVDSLIAMFGQAMNPIIRADGSPRFAMASTLAGAVLNMILDPDFLTFLVSIVVIILAYRELKQTEK